jgi:hypothetical protein
MYVERMVIIPAMEVEARVSIPLKIDRMVTNAIKRAAAKVLRKRLDEFIDKRG